jgi:hypothetical protein
MAPGPMQILIDTYPGNQFKGEIALALAELVDTGTIRVIDFVFITKDPDGTITSLELADLDDRTVSAFAPAMENVSGTFSEADIEELGDLLDNSSSSGLMLFENTCAARFVDAVRNARGEVLFSERVPRAVIEDAMVSGDL